MSKNKHYENLQKCLQCGKCCNYFSIEIDIPEDDEDYDDLKWILAHRDVAIHVEAERWCLMVRNPCRYLGEGNKCEIYDHRPNICRSHVPGECDQDAVSDACYEDIEFVLSSIEDLEKYRQEHEAE